MQTFGIFGKENEDIHLLASVNFFWDRKKSLGNWIHRSVVSVSTNSTFLIEGYSVRLSLFWSIKVTGFDWANSLRLSDLAGPRLGLGFSLYSVRSSTFHNNQVYGTVGFPVRVFLLKRLFNS